MRYKFPFIILAWACLLIALLVLFYQFPILLNQEISFAEIERFSSVAPHAAQGNFAESIKQSIHNNYNCINQFFLYQGIKSTIINVPSQMRFIDCFFMAFAIIWIFRLARTCANGTVAALAALTLACCPISFWSDYAICIFLVIFNLDRFLYVLQNDHLLSWAIWGLTTALLFLNWIFAEPILLQSWFIALVSVSIIHLIFQPKDYKNIDYYGKIIDFDDHVYRHEAQNVQDLLTIISLIIIFASSIACFIVFVLKGAEFKLSNIVIVLIASSVFALLLLYAFLAVPNIRRRFHSFKSLITSNSMSPLFEYKSDFRKPIRWEELVNLLFFYAAAVLLVSPILYWSKNSLDIYISFFEFEKLKISLPAINSAEFILLICLPFVSLIWTWFGVHYKLLAPSRFFYALYLVSLASLYLFQQRYAPYAAPFYIIACLISIVTPFELIILGIRRKYVKI